MNWKREVIGILEDHYAQRQAMVAMSLELERLSLAVPSSCSQNQRLAHLVAERVLQQNYQRTALLVKRTECALDALSATERQLLEMLYILPRRGNQKMIMHLQGICKSTFYRRRDRALQKFTVALYGS